MSHNHTTAPGSFELTPRYLAASPPTDHQFHIAHFAVTREWLHHTSSNTFTAISPGGRITVHHDRRAEGHGPHLVITARPHPGGPPIWRADIAGSTPVEFLSALTDTIASHLEADPEQLIYGRGSDPELLPLTVDPQRWEDISDPGLAGFRSRDGHAYMIGRPAGSPAPPLEGDESLVWHIGADVEQGAVWAVFFTHQTPPIVVNAVLAQTLDTAPVTRPGTMLPIGLAPFLTLRPAQSPIRHERPGPADEPPHGHGTRRPR